MENLCKVLIMLSVVCISTTAFGQDELKALKNEQTKAVRSHPTIKVDQEFVDAVKHNAEEYAGLEGKTVIQRGITYKEIPLEQWSGEALPAYSKKRRENVHIYGSDQRVDEQKRFLMIPIELPTYELNAIKNH